MCIRDSISAVNIDTLSDKKRQETINQFNEILKGKINFIKDIRGEDDLIYIKYANELNRICNKEIFNLDKQKAFMEKLKNSIFILQSRYTCVQGTGFLLKGIGLITNYHVTEDDDFYDVCMCNKNKICLLYTSRCV